MGLCKGPSLILAPFGIWYNGIENFCCIFCRTVSRTRIPKLGCEALSYWAQIAGPRFKTKPPVESFRDPWSGLVSWPVPGCNPVGVPPSISDQIKETRLRDI